MTAFTRASFSLTLYNAAVQFPVLPAVITPLELSTFSHLGLNPGVLANSSKVFSTFIPSPNSVAFVVNNNWLNQPSIIAGYLSKLWRSTTWWDSQQPYTYGRGVAISNRHVVFIGGHPMGFDVKRHLHWIGLLDPEDDNSPTLSHSDYIADFVPTVRLEGISDEPQEHGMGHLSVAYMQNNIPAECIATLPRPTDFTGVTDWTGLPVLMFNQSNEIVVLALGGNPGRAPLPATHQHIYPQGWPNIDLIRPLHPVASVANEDPDNSDIYRQHMEYTWKPPFWGDDGMPIFLISNYGAVYFGHLGYIIPECLSNRDAASSGPCVLGSLNGTYLVDRIMQACALLNSRNAAMYGGDGSLPAYVGD